MGPLILRTASRILIIQARLGSERRFGKSLAQIGDVTLLEHVVQRALQVRGIEKIFIATTTNSEDDLLSIFVRDKFGKALTVFRGHPDDVQSRFTTIAMRSSAFTIGRITADDPFKDPNLYSQAFEVLENSDADYASVGTTPIPLGMDVEVFRAASLFRSRSIFRSVLDREHVTWSLARKPDFKRIFLDLPSLVHQGARLTVDYDSDLVFTSLVSEEIKRLGGSFDHETTLRALRATLETKSN